MKQSAQGVFDMAISVTIKTNGLDMTYEIKKVPQWVLDENAKQEALASERAIERQKAIDERDKIIRAKEECKRIRLEEESDSIRTANSMLVKLYGKRLSEDNLSSLVRPIFLCSGKKFKYQTINDWLMNCELKNRAIKEITVEQLSKLFLNDMNRRIDKYNKSRGR
jgi:hypothetical protein